MVTLPKNEITEESKMELLFNWYNKQQELKKLQASEKAMRDTVVSVFFPEGMKEGTNNFKLSTGDVLSVVNPMNRKVDKAVFSSIIEQMIEKGIDVNEVVETKVELKVGAYRKLTVEQLAVMDECITMTQGSPQVTVKVKS